MRRMRIVVGMLAIHSMLRGAAYPQVVGEGGVHDEWVGLARTGTTPHHDAGRQEVEGRVRER